MAETANEELRDALIRHQIGLLRVSGKMRNDIFKLLDATEKDLSDEIVRRMAKLTGQDVTRPAVLKRLEFLEAKVREIRSTALDEVFELWEAELKQVAAAESTFVVAAMNATAPVVLGAVLPNVDQLNTLVTAKPFDGKVLKDWASDLKRGDLNRISQQIRIGMTQGEAPRQIARRVVGTAQLKGTNGVTQITRRNAEAITRTAVNHVANQAKRTVYEANSDLFDEELYVSTLDSRTTPICRSLDGKKFPVGQGAIPPMHFSCRSTRVPSFDGTTLGERPMRTATERRLVREYAEENGLDPKLTQRNKLPRGHKGKFDQFSRRRVRELTGTTPASTNYQEFLSQQSLEFQEDVLGVTKAQLFRKGKLPLDRFVDRAGKELTLAELAVKERSSFLAAGLDPGDF